MSFTNLSVIHPDELIVETAPVSPATIDDNDSLLFDDLNDENIQSHENDYISSTELDISLSDDNNSDLNNKAIKTAWMQDTEKLNSILKMSPDITQYEEEKEPKKQIDRGDGKMDYIKDSLSRIMLENAWKAINLTETWDFVAQPKESFMFSNDKRIWLITGKMEELGYKSHSGFSFGWTMRNMQYLAINGVEEFKKGFIKTQIQ